MVRVMINLDNDAPVWWSSGGNDLWNKFLHTRDKYGYLNLDEKTAVDFVKTAERISGWYTPDMPYAPFPLVFQNNEGDALSYENETFVIVGGYHERSEKR